MKYKSLSESKVKNLLEDFLSFSGGFSPDECNKSQIESYFQKSTSFLKELEKEELLDAKEYLINYKSPDSHEDLASDRVLN